MEELLLFILKYKWRILFVLLGVLLTVLLLTLGFWKTLLLGVIVAACYFVGTLMDSGGKESITGLFKALFKRQG